MPKTAYHHFTEDISRAKELLNLSLRLPSSQPRTLLIRNDVLRSAWMFSIGALDAYFCDAYADLMASCLISKDRLNRIRLGRKIGSIQLPVGAYFRPQKTRQNWRWRMASRQIIERDNVLSLAKIHELLNPFLPTGSKLFGDVLDGWISSPEAKIRLFNVSRNQYRQMTRAQKKRQRKLALVQLNKRFSEIFQRRHDCIHNCDRPKIAVQRISSPGTVKNVIKDVEFLVGHCERHLNREFPNFLISIGCDRATLNQLNY